MGETAVWVGLAIVVAIFLASAVLVWFFLGGNAGIAYALPSDFYQR